MCNTSDANFTPTAAAARLSCRRRENGTDYERSQLCLSHAPAGIALALLACCSCGRVLGQRLIARHGKRLTSELVSSGNGRLLFRGWHT